MTTSSDAPARDEAILLARILLILLFVVFGWGKLTNYDTAVGYMTRTGLPMPSIAAIVAIVLEFFVGLATAVGFWTRPLALLLAVYTLATALIGHHFWTLAGPERLGSAINFYKNLCIVGGFLLLYVTGPGKYSLDAMLGVGKAAPARAI